ncbi:leucine-rich repeat, cysteine-containing subtype protein, partial [Tanacetum coccineum]
MIPPSGNNAAVLNVVEISGGISYFVGLSRLWYTPAARPTFYDDDEEEMRLQDIIKVPNPFDVVCGKKNLLENERPILEQTADVVTPPFDNIIRKLKLAFEDLDEDRHGLLFKRCPNLEVLYTNYGCGDKRLQVIGKLCKKLRKITHNGLVTHTGLIALAKGCTKLECLKVSLGDISNEAIKCLGTHLKNLQKFHMDLVKKDGTIDLPLDNGIQAMLMGCRKHERLDIRLWHEGLTDVGLEYIGKYGANLSSLSLSRIGNSDEGLVKLSEGCLKLRKLKLIEVGIVVADRRFGNLVLVGGDEDLETLARTRGRDLRSLKIRKCEGFSTDGIMHVSKCCNQLRTLCLKYCYHIEVIVKDEHWLHQLALNSTVLEMFNFKNTNISDTKDVTLLANKCCKSLISLKIRACCLSKLGDAFRYVVRLAHFGGDIHDEESGLVGFQFPSNMHSLSLENLAVTRYLIVLPFLNHIRKLKLAFLDFDCKCQCLLFKRCPNLEDLSTNDVCGDKGLQVIEVRLGGISNEAIKQWDWAMLMGCSKLERLDIWHGGLADAGLEYIGKYGANLRSLSLTRIGNSIAGLVKLSEGCPRLRKLKLND